MQAWLGRGICLLMGALFSLILWSGGGTFAWMPFALATFMVAAEWASRRVRFRSWFPVFIGLSLGLSVGAIAAYVVSIVLPPEISYRRALTASLAVLFASLGIFAFSSQPEFSLFAWKGAEFAGKSNAVRILDTSVIIDGRIANICRTGFLDGELIIPRFVLKELQYIADSADTLRRNKGRRGLEVLGDLQENPDLAVRIVDEDFPHIREVDAKLVALAKALGGKILTNDYNLKTVAEIQGVNVLNVNELANSVKPEILQGEVMTVRVVREGKEPGQGVAYLDDGTMVVIDNGKYFMGQTIPVEVTSVLQTSAGRMIFARKRDEGRESGGRYEKTW